MDLDDFAANGGFAFVIGSAPGFSPARYATFKVSHPGGWTWTDELTKAETFATKGQAERHMRGNMGRLVDGDRRVTVLKVQMRVEMA